VRVEQSSTIVGIGTTEYLMFALSGGSPIVFTFSIANLSNIILAASLLEVAVNARMQTSTSSNLSKCLMEIVSPMYLYTSKMHT